MAKTVFGAPVGWYDATPLGRIFNRFSSDVITLDKDLMNDISSYSDMVNPKNLFAIAVSCTPTGYRTGVCLSWLKLPALRDFFSRQRAKMALFLFLFSPTVYRILRYTCMFQSDWNGRSSNIYIYI